MSAEHVKSINELCEIYHGLDCDRTTDTAVINLLLSSLGYAPVGDMPQTVQASINTFRKIGHQDRYNFALTAISYLLETPSKNFTLYELFNRLILKTEPLTDGFGQAVIEGGKLSFGPYCCALLSQLIYSNFSERQSFVDNL